MIPRLILVFLIGIISFYALPFALAHRAKRRKAKDLRLFRTTKPEDAIRGTLCALIEDRITICTNAVEKGIPVIPSRTRFYILEADGLIGRLNWHSVLLVQKGLEI